LLDIYAQRPPDLHILDALTVMDGDGPTHGRVRPWGRLLASRDGLALDAAAAQMVGLEPRSLSVLRAAAARGMIAKAGVGVDSLEIEGDAEPLGDFLLPATFSASPEEQRALLHEVGHLKPVVDAEACQQCGECVSNCPAGAISLSPYPIVSEACIACFCCAELCPVGAMQAPLGRVREAFDRMF
jgi:ferredoxin